MAYGKIAAHQFQYEKDINFVLDTSIHAIKHAIRKIKKATVKKPVAYFYTVTLNKFAQQFYQPEDASGDEVGGVYTRGKSMFSFISS